MLRCHTPLTRYIICFFDVFVCMYTIQVQLGQAMEENIPIISRIFQSSDDEPCIASTKIHDYFLDAITYISFVAVIQANIGYY